MAGTEKVLFSRGPRATMPETKVPGTILITTDTREMFLDDTEDSRIQIGGQSDWLQNNSSDPSYIKNRTHWVEEKEVRTTIYSASSVEFAESDNPGYYTAMSLSNTGLEEGKKYAVRFDDQPEIISTASIITDAKGLISLVYIGGSVTVSDAIEFLDDGSGSHISIIDMSDGVDTGYMFLTDSTASTHSIEIDVIDTQEVVHKIDKKYIPESHFVGQVVSSDSDTGSDDSGEYAMHIKNVTTDLSFELVDKARITVKFIEEVL